MIERMPDEEYFKLDCVSNSLLSRLARCPAAIALPLEQTAAMKLGSVVHTLILEGAAVFYQRYAVSPECDKRTKEGKAIYQEFCGANEGKIVISLDDLLAAQGMAESVYSHPSCRDILSDGEPEMAITWEEEGINCKAKADWLSPRYLIDLKTTTDSSEHQFSRTITNSSYFRQMAFYRSGLKANGVHIEKCIIIAVESKPPFTVGVYSLDEDYLTAGEGYYKGLLHKYKEVKDMKTLPAYVNGGIVELFAPAWMNN
jgi:hypothetical protein